MAALDVIPQTRSVRFQIGMDATFAYVIEKHINPESVRPTFCAAVLRKWRSNAVCDVLRARGTLTDPLAHQSKVENECAARQRADIEKHGLRECAWPSCVKVERTVREFKQCSGCRSVWYCGCV